MNVPSRFQYGRMASSASASFDAFYDAAVRREPSYRIRSTDLHAAYHAWAVTAGAARLHHRDIKREMEKRGHRHLISNGSHFCDTVIIEPVHFDLAAGKVIEDPAEQLLARIDMIADCLDKLRRQATACLKAVEGKR